MNISDNPHLHKTEVRRCFTFYKSINSYEVADLMAEFANWYFIKNKRVS